MRAVVALAALAALVPVAAAADPGFYHPDDIAKESQVFVAVADRTGPAFEQRQQTVNRASDAMAALEIGTLLLGDDAPAPVRAWTEDTRRQVTGQVLRLQRHVDLLQEDYAKVFLDALGRAKTTVGKGYDLKECASRSMLAMRNQASCVGANLNIPLAKAMDADPLLKSELDAIAAVEWPSVTLPTAPMPVVELSGTARWVEGAALARMAISPRLDAKAGALERTLDPILADGATPAALKKAEAARKVWEGEMGEEGKRFRAVVAEALGRLEKKGVVADVGWCANPPALGGCEGEDATAKVLSALTDDKKFQKEIAKQFAEKRGSAPPAP